jgi:hypothetical protein
MNLIKVNIICTWGTSWTILCIMKLWIHLIRDRPFNLQGGFWFFVLFRNFFSDNTRVGIFIFFQNLTSSYMTKTLNQIIFFFLHQNQNIFFSNIGNQNIFLEKNHNPPPSSYMVVPFWLFKHPSRFWNWWILNWFWGGFLALKLFLFALIYTDLLWEKEKCNKPFFQDLLDHCHWTIFH